MRRIKRLIKIWILLTILALGATAWRGYRMYDKALEGRPLEARLREMEAGADYTPLNELPKTYTDAVVAVEDHRFREHMGVDFISVGRALWNNLRAGAMKEGGSTITQQLARNLFFTQDKDLARKFAEVFAALDLERSCTKNEILELYVNTIYFGDGYYGIRQASLGYYGKEPARLDGYECTMLAGIPNAPSVYAPTQNPDLAKKRQAAVVGQMVKYGYLTQEEGSRILTEGN